MERPMKHPIHLIQYGTHQPAQVAPKHLEYH